jgi:hypothetical protein
VGNAKAAHELLVLATVLDLNNGLGTLVDDLERPVLHVCLNLGIGELATDQALGVEDGVVGVHGDLVLGGIANETLRVVEGDIRGSGSVALVVGYVVKSADVPKIVRSIAIHQ